MKLTDFRSQVPLAPYATFKIGGPAKYFFQAKTTQDLLASVNLARQQHLPYLILGKGSNVLFSDKGFNGLVIVNQTSEIKIFPHHQVELDSGVFLPKAILTLINQGLTGLEVFSGIPATVGGATAVKMHGVGALWSDFVVQVNRDQDLILSVVLQLQSGDKAAALAKFKKIQQQKQLQPQISAGCIFKNLPDGRSVGEIIDKQLHLKGTRVGQAQISLKHANFIENLGGAKASDVIRLIKLIQKTALTKLKLNLKPEIIIYE